MQCFGLLLAVLLMQNDEHTKVIFVPETEPCHVEYLLVVYPEISSKYLLRKIVLSFSFMSSIFKSNSMLYGPPKQKFILLSV